MRDKLITVISLLLLSMLIPNISVYASTTKELYELYDLDYKSSCSQNIVDTIMDANKAEIMVYQYNNLVVLDTFNKSTLLKLKEDAMKYKEQLRNAYNLPYDEIIDIEDKYIAAEKRYNNYQARLDNYKSVSMDQIELPSKEELKSARKSYTTYVDSTFIGSLEDCPQLLSSVDDCQHDPTQSVYYTHNATVRSLFNGTVSATTDDSVTIELPDYITFKVIGLESVEVKPNQKVKQGDIIGIASNKVTAGINIDGHKYNLSELAKEGTTK